MEKVFSRETLNRIQGIMDCSRVKSVFRTILYDSKVLEEMRINGGRFIHEFELPPATVKKVPWRR